MSQHALPAAVALALLFLVRQRASRTVAPATRTLPLCIEYKSADPTAQLVLAAASLVQGWPSAQPAKVTQIQGGITNLLWKVECGPRAALVRVYGENTEVMIDRQLECVLFAELSRRGFGPQLHGLFANGRVEGYTSPSARRPCPSKRCWPPWRWASLQKSSLGYKRCCPRR
jgi:hypothetical protein